MQNAPLFSKRLPKGAETCVTPGPHNGWRVRMVCDGQRDEHFALFEAFADARELARRVRKAGRYDPARWKLGGARMEVTPRPMSIAGAQAEAYMQARMRRAQRAALRVAPTHPT